jgi:hypothetical protein
MAHGSVNKRMIIAGAALVLAVLVPLAVYIRYGSPGDPDGVETAEDATPTTLGPDHRRAALSSFGDPVDRIGEATTSTTEPTPPATAEGASPSTSDEQSTGGGGGRGGSTTSCPLPAYPSASCTGVPAGTKLAVHNGDLEVGTPNTVIDGLDIRGCVFINAPDVVVRRSRMTCVSSDVGAYNGTGVVVEDVEIDCGGSEGTTAVSEYNFSVRRANIHSCENGFHIEGQVTVEDSYIHDLIAYDSATDPHTDGAQITPSGSNIVLNHNTIYAGDGTSAIISPNVADGVVSNVLVKDNLMAGGAYTLYCQQDGPGDNYRVVNNHFSTVFYPNVALYAAWTECKDEAQVTGNVFHETGRAVPPTD